MSPLGLSPKLDLPSTLPNAGFNAAQLSLDLSADTFTQTGQTANGAAVAGNWTFSQISSGLSVPDFLVFQQAYLIVSSFTKSQFAA